MQRLHIENTNINDTQIENFSTSLIWNEQAISLQQLGLTSSGITLDTTGQVEQDAGLPTYSLALKWQQEREEEQRKDFIRKGAERAAEAYRESLQEPIDDQP